MRPNQRPALIDAVVPARPAASPPKRPLSAEGAARRQQHRAVAQPLTPPPSPVAPPRKKDFRPPPTPPTRQKKFLGSLQLPLIVLGGIGAGLIVQSVAVGQIIILAYGVVAVIFRIESRTTLTLALLALLTTVTAAITQPGSLLDKNFAIYAFLLLIVGIISATIEHQQQRRLLVKKRGPQRLTQRAK